ncbi:MAG: twin-arginine translocation signal domain-containing protein [Verrucomicrobiota bacterium]
MQNKHITRRDFMKVAGLAGAASAVTPRRAFA